MIFTERITGLINATLEVTSKRDRDIAFLSFLKQCDPPKVGHTFTNINAIRRRKFRRLTRRLVRDATYSPEQCWEEMQRV